jgi:hypothetical protein
VRYGPADDLFHERVLLRRAERGGGGALDLDEFHVGNEEAGRPAEVDRGPCVFERHATQLASRDDCGTACARDSTT